ncbi:MAG: Mycothione reductase [Acidimicrobiales bacterium AG-410-I20]|nr:MAG: Mycothione reductase [Acidimicrobiales bacterium AG-410-I20]
MPHYDLLIIGAGSGNSIIDERHDEWDIAIIEPGEFGGTCLNRGCVPSKMFIYAADQAYMARTNEKFGIETNFVNARWPEIRDRVFNRIDPITESGLDYRISLSNVTVYRNTAQFIDEQTVQTGEDIVTAEQIVIAAGARPEIPKISGLDQVPYLTSDEIMRISDLPSHLVIIGGGFIAVEMAHIFSSFGSEVTIIHRGSHLLRGLDSDISNQITEIYKERFNLLLETEVDDVTYNQNFQLNLSSGETIECDQLLVSTGRIPNTDQLNVSKGKIEIMDTGHIVTNPFLQTSAEGVWAIGDITNPIQLKHLANADARIVGHNLCNPQNLLAVDRSLSPAAVFGYPPIASVGLTEQHAVAEGIPYLVVNRSFADTAYGWAMEDSTSFVKLLADPENRTLLGAHLIGPQSPTLIQQLIQGMTLGQTVDEMGKAQLYIHPALPEVIEQALLEFKMK